ncbi:hypothetical protein [Actinomadura mexicana]|uniref:Uncharacterized protein n=1 Tax=Actinomadura mexicana TaxID=134959 RepID=A0A239D7V6_9ACTN|nr:hypothetical protein [Actinomadura mexicana]SNS28359.1 hypothetical protein SAMN06265355_11434 [Actinomadura mexicana]
MKTTIIGTTILHGVLAIAIGAIAGMIIGGFIEDLAHTVHLVETYYRDGRFPAGIPDSALISDLAGAGAGDPFVAGAFGGFVGFIGAVLRDAYRAAYGDAVARDDCGRFVAGGIVFAVVTGFAVIVTTGDLGLITVTGVFAAAIGGCAAGAAVGTVSVDG